MQFDSVGREDVAVVGIDRFAYIMLFTVVSSGHAGTGPVGIWARKGVHDAWAIGSEVEGYM